MKRQAATECYFGDKQPFHVFCWDSPPDKTEPGDFVLATRTIFPNRQSAEVYARTIAPSRCPLVIPRCEILEAAEQGRYED